MRYSTHHVGSGTTLAVALAFAWSTMLAQTSVYVAPTGLDTNPGTLGSPFKTITKGVSTAKVGGTVYLRGGMYAMSAKLTLSGAGSATSTTKIWAYPGELPVINCAGNTSDGISISGSYYHLRGLDVMKAGHNGINISGSNNLIENCRIHDNGNTGLHLTGSAAPGPSNNLILNCDAFMNYDPPIGGNADGFSTKWTVGPGNIFRGCRAWNNSDDGWDLWMGTSTVVIESCFAYRNGWDSWFSGSFDGNGNGFKLGGNYVATPHITRNCVAFDNKGNGGRGFDENNNTGGQTVYNCTAFRNQGDNFHFKNTVVAGQTHLIKNCVSLQGAIGISSGNLQRNSWQGFTVSSADFVSLDTAQVSAPRTPDGQLPDMTFLHLLPSSSLIDAGVDVGLPASGNGPDLGAFEYRAPSSIVEDGRGMPTDPVLDQNFPNPFNPTTVISYQLSAVSSVSLRVLDMLGREVSMLVNGTMPAGRHTATWHAEHQPSGTYLLELRTEDRIQSIRMMLVR